MTELFLLSATEAISLIQSEKITILELTESILKRISKINPKLHSFVNRNDKYNLKIAKNLDQKFKRGEDLGSLFGISIGVKDIFNEQFMPTEMGSPIWKGFTPGNDARIVHNIRISNGLIIGKTDTAEFAVHSLGKSLNPYDPLRTPGSSSSGSATAVASYMVPLALGTQTAGSIIRPASYCGVYGFKPSFGLIPRTGMLKTTDSLDQIGFFGRHPKDLNLLFDVIRVKGKNYPISNKILENPENSGNFKRKWKICFTKTSVWENAEEYTKIFFENFIKNLKKKNEFQVTELFLPKEFDLAHKMHQAIYAKSLSYYFKNELKNKTLVSKIFYDFASHAKKIDMKQFDLALNYQSQISKFLDKQFQNFDIVISLSTTGHAPLRNKEQKNDPCLIWTMCGVPTINLPVFNTKENLPLGIQVLSRKYNDLLLLQFVNLLHQMNITTTAPYPPLEI
jgi:Asp-tRNA(Asn)/Glu-tRNA(Gln) amidotransferase A subunit family amidase